MTKISATEHPAIVEAYEKGGQSTIALGQKYGVTATAIASILRKNGVEMRPALRGKPSASMINDKRVVSTYKSGYTLEATAKLFDVSVGTILKVLNRNGVQRRTQGKVVKPTKKIGPGGIRIG